MQGQARVLKAIDTKTGRITLCGVGAERLAQATAAGLVSGELRADVEMVRRENERLTGALAAKGEGDFAPGEWCRFCKAKAICRARGQVRGSDRNERH